MRKTALSIAAALAFPLAASAQVSAGVSAGFRIDLPVVIPQLVVVSPGVQVIPEVDHEVFFVNGVYWTRHDGGWYRSPNPRSGWVLVPGRGVPATLVKIPPGKYKRWKPGKGNAKAGPASYKAGKGHGGDHGHGKKGKGHGKH